MIGCYLGRHRHGIPSRKFGMPDELNREPRANRGRARHCYPILSRWTRGNPVGLSVPLSCFGKLGRPPTGEGSQETCLSILYPSHVPKYSRATGVIGDSVDRGGPFTIW